MEHSPIDEFETYYQAGIAVIVVKNGRGARRLSLGFGSSFVVLEPVRTCCTLNAGTDFGKVNDIEDFVTGRMAGVAGRFIRANARRSQIANAFGRAGFLEMKYMRRLLQCLDREADRAYSIVFGSLGKVDDGDAEGTIYRRWKRANRLLREEPQRR